MVRTTTSDQPQGKTDPEPEPEPPEAQPEPEVKAGADEPEERFKGLSEPMEVTTGGKGSLRVVQRGSNGEDADVKNVRLDQQNLWIKGKGFQERVEVVVNFDALDGGETNARVSKWTEDGSFIFQIPSFVRPATYRISAYVPQERVGDDPTTIKMVDQVTVTIDPIRV